MSKKPVEHAVKSSSEKLRQLILLHIDNKEYSKAITLCGQLITDEDDESSKGIVIYLLKTNPKLVDKILENSKTLIGENIELEKGSLTSMCNLD